MPMKRSNQSMIQGPLFSGIVFYTIPIILTSVLQLLFNAADLNQALSDMGGLIGVGGLPLLTNETVYYLKSYARLFIVAIIGATPVVKAVANKLYSDSRTAPVMAVLEPLFLILLFVVCSSYLVDGSFNPFLYFRF